MANIDGLGALNTSSGTAKLIAAYGPDLVDVDNNTGYQQNITSGNKAEFEQFVDNLFFNNYTDRPRHFNGTSWKYNLAQKFPLAKYMKRRGTKLYFGYTKLPQSGIVPDPLGSSVDSELISFPSRVFFTDNAVEKGKLESGIFFSAKGKTLSDEDNIFRLSTILGTGLKDVGIKAGDPLYMLVNDTGDDAQVRNAGRYTVVSVDAQDQLTLLEPVPKQANEIHFWVGSNWFDFDTEDGDFITGLGENNNRLLVFKNYSLGRYDGRSLVKVKGVPGTTSHRSIQNIRDKFTVYFHGSSGSRTGFYLYDGVSARKISSAFDKHIAGISSSIYPDITAWTEGSLYRAYIGDLTNSNFDINLSKAVWTFDSSTNTQSIDPIGKAIKASTQLRENNILNTYIADNDDSVFKTGTESVYAYDTSPISWSFETHEIYPEGSEALLTFTRVQVIARNARGIRLEYKLINDPREIDKDWQPLGDIEYDKTEFVVPLNHSTASGIRYRAVNIDSAEPDMLFEKISTFYKIEGTNYASIISG